MLVCSLTPASACSGAGDRQTGWHPRRLAPAELVAQHLRRAAGRAGPGPSREHRLLRRPALCPAGGVCRAGSLCPRASAGRAGGGPCRVSTQDLRLHLCARQELPESTASFVDQPALLVASAGLAASALVLTPLERVRAAAIAALMDTGAAFVRGCRAREVQSLSR